MASSSGELEIGAHPSRPLPRSRDVRGEWCKRERGILTSYLGLMSESCGNEITFFFGLFCLSFHRFRLRMFASFEWFDEKFVLRIKTLMMFRRQILFSGLLGIFAGLKVLTCFFKSSVEFLAFDGWNRLRGTKINAFSIGCCSLRAYAYHSPNWECKMPIR